MNYFKTVGGVLILIGVIGLELLFAAGIWFMIAVGMTPALGDAWSLVLASIAAPVIAILAIVLFIYGPRLKQIILEWEAENGKLWDEDHQVYYNKTSYTRIVDVMKGIVFAVDTAAILYRVLLEHVPWYGQFLLAVVFELLAISPFFVGTLVHIVAHRPIAAIRRDAQYIRDVTEAQNEIDDALATRNRKRIPATARHGGNAPTAQLPGPKTETLPEYQANQQSQSQSPNGKR